tara:strand:- start:659 stop:1405 length:747 start_codon:yes stop_codon:yes gene_type:complete
MNKFFDEYNEVGYFKIKNFLEKNEVSKIELELEKCLKNKGILKYKDKNGKIRRIEKIYDKGKFLKQFDLNVKKLLKKIFQKKYSIFKDKLNIKPPGGEGFFAHYDGIFKFKNKNNKILNGWYEYSDNFINILLAINSCNKKNGTIELAKATDGNFYNLLKNTNKDGSPNLKKSYESKLNFKHIDLEVGDIIIFSNKCPHRSKKNKSNKNRKTLYYTYTISKSMNLYKKYFLDKVSSKNKNSKSLTGEI